MPVVLTVIGLTPPFGWRLESLTVHDPQSSTPQGGLAAVSPSGSLFVIYPFGAPGFGIDPDITSSETDILVDGLSARRTDYLDQNGDLTLSIIAFSSIQGYHSFEVLLRPSRQAPGEIATLENILDTLELPGGS